MIKQELPDAQVHQAKSRAITSLMKSYNYRSLGPECLQPRTDVFFFYKTSKKYEPIEWRPGTVVLVKPYYVTIRTATDKVTSLAYEGARIVPNNDLAKELSGEVIEDYILPLPNECRSDQESEFPSRTVDDYTRATSTNITSLSAKASNLRCQKLLMRQYKRNMPGI